MEIKTNLRVLRRRHHISLKELAIHAELSNQYISQAELGYIRATERLERQMEAAVAALIARRENDLLALKTDYETYRGRLLRPAEDMDDE